MNNEPLNTGTLEHYLVFKNDETGEVRIDEPIGFDSSNFVIKQRNDGYGRDISFAGEQSDFVFPNTCHVYGFAFEKLIEYDKRYGSESEVDYILREGSEDYVVGEVDFFTGKNDQILEFSCKVIQETDSAFIKRRKDANVNLFDDEDLDGNPITPVETQRILLKAKPITQISKWTLGTIYWAFTNYANGNTDNRTTLQNPINNIINQNIQNTLSLGFDNTLITFPSDTDFYNKFYNFGYVDAINDMKNITIDLTGLKLSYFIETGSDFFGNFRPAPTDNINIKIVALPIGKDNYTQADVYPNPITGFNIAYTHEHLIDYTATFVGSENVDRFDPFTGNRDKYEVVFLDQQFDIQDIPRGYRICVLIDTARGQTIVEWLEGEISMKSTNVAIDSVVEGVRLIDAMKQVSKSINPKFNLSAPRFDIEGEWYDNFVFSGNMIRGRNVLDDSGEIIPFRYRMSWKDIIDGLKEFHSDYEVDGTKLFVGKYDDFYTNTEIDSFTIAPNNEFNITYNERYGINQLDFKYKKFNQDKDDSNTIDSVHTSTQWLNKNKRVENTKVVECGFIRDPLLMETTRLKSVRETSTSLTEDDETFINDVVPLLPNTKGGFTSSLNHFINNDGRLQLLNDSSFNWTLLGFNLGDTITIDTNVNTGTYEVFEYSQNIITLTPISASPTATGDILTRISFFFSNVSLTIRTDEGFDSIENIDAPEDFANLRYTPKRNILNNYGSYLKTATRYRPEVIKNTYYKNGGRLRTQFNGEAVISERKNIEQSELKDAILTPKIITTKVMCDFAQYRNLSSKIKSKRGFIRISDNEFRMVKVFPQKIDFSWADNLMEVIGEEKHERDFVSISKEGGIIKINETGYDQDLIAEIEYKAEGEYVQIFDKSTRPLINLTRYDLIEVNGVLFSTMLELITALENL